MSLKPKECQRCGSYDTDSEGDCNQCGGSVFVNLSPFHKIPPSTLEEPFMSFTLSGGFRGVVFNRFQAELAFAVEAGPDAVLCVKVPHCYWAVNLAQAVEFFGEKK